MQPSSAIFLCDAITIISSSSKTSYASIHGRDRPPSASYRISCFSSRLRTTPRRPHHTKLKLGNARISWAATTFNSSGTIFAYAVGYDWSKGYMANNQNYPNKVMLHPIQGDECKPRPNVKKR